MAKLDQEALSQIVGAVLASLQAQGAASAAPVAKAGNSLEQKDKALIAGFARRGIKNVVLMDRSDPAKAHDVRPYQGWLKLGYQVRKGEKGIRGLFHQSQCDRIAPKAPAKPAPKGKAKLTSVKAQLPLV